METDRRSHLDALFRLGDAKALEAWVFIVRHGMHRVREVKPLGAIITECNRRFRHHLPAWASFEYPGWTVCGVCYRVGRDEG